MLCAYGERFGLDRETAFRVAGAFGGGMARRGEVCGAVTGALMVIGLKHGKIRADADDAKERTYELTNEFMDRFKEETGALLCRDLLGYELTTPEGRRAVAEKKLFETLCPRFLQNAGEILESLISEK